jgi:hypothetical protein
VCASAEVGIAYTDIERLGSEQTVHLQTRSGVSSITDVTLSSLQVNNIRSVSLPCLEIRQF